MIENVTLLEDQKSAIFFRVFNVVKDLEGPPLIKGSTLISADELDSELSKLKDKWDGQFNDLLYFTEDNMHMWTFDYVNLNKNMSIFISYPHESLIHVEREIFEMKIK